MSRALSSQLEIDAPSRAAFDRVLAHNATLIRELNEKHAQMLAVGQALAAWADAWGDDASAGLIADAALLMHIETEWSKA